MRHIIYVKRKMRSVLTMTLTLTLLFQRNIVFLKVSSLISNHLFVVLLPVIVWSM